MSKKEYIKEWQPHFLIFGEKAFSRKPPFERNRGFYDRSWFCINTNTIHHSEKSVLNCNHCSKNYYTMTRKEHIKWCIARAEECLDRNELTEAIASFVCDMTKHQETIQRIMIFVDSDV